jgi:arabinose-5-phosphate isomerase
MTNQDYIIANEVADAAIEGITALKSNFKDAEFTKLINAIASIPGKVILSGMGKSGHVARKIAATLASTGTPSFFIHPGEASHGDLGMIAKTDIVILLSNSGETKELSDIINYCKRYGIILVGVARNKDSTLINHADIKIIIPKIAEALLFDAPTTSTTMMLVLGDAIAMSLLRRKNFNREDFQVFHPGGRLGTSFFKIKDIMTSGDNLPYILKNATYEEVIKAISLYKKGCLALINSDFTLKGIITDGDIRRSLLDNLRDIDKIMSHNPVVIEKNKLVVEALDLMSKKQITNIFVVNNYQDKKVVGFVHIHDCLTAGANSQFETNAEIK